jgi:RNA polymerase sigma factor (sigma-70 family)
MAMINDQHYINLIIEGDSNAFAVLVDRYKNMVFSLALKMVKNREEAEEVAQDTFIKVFKSLVKFKGDSKFSTWVYKVTYNTCLDRININNIKVKLFRSRKKLASLLERRLEPEILEYYASERK